MCVLWELRRPSSLLHQLHGNQGRGVSDSQVEMYFLGLKVHQFKQRNTLYTIFPHYECHCEIWMVEHFRSSYSQKLLMKISGSILRCERVSTIAGIHGKQLKRVGERDGIRQRMVTTILWNGGNGDRPPYCPQNCSVQPTQNCDHLWPQVSISVDAEEAYRSETL